MDPCTNFDHMVCDGFNARHDIPADASGFSTASLMSENGKIQLRHILESSYPNASQVSKAK
jgi:endothelin-converting enzyme